MRIQKKWLARLAVLVMAGPLPVLAVWFSGGAYDGYEHTGEGPALDWPQVNNASGATNVTDSAAWLNGMLIYTGSAPTSVMVYWGKTNGGTDTGSWSNSHAFGTVSERVPLTHQVSLDPGNTYFYRFYAGNTASETGWALDSTSFTTPSPPEVSVGVGASPVSRTSATLNGALTAGVIADVTVYWGTHSGAWSHTNHLGTRAEGALAISLSDLSPGTTYGYQISATNEYGTDQSEIEWFDTLSGAVWFGGGSYDGFDHLMEPSELRTSDGTLFIFR